MKLYCITLHCVALYRIVLQNDVRPFRGGRRVAPTYYQVGVIWAARLWQKPAVTAVTRGCYGEASLGVNRYHCIRGTAGTIVGGATTRVCVEHREIRRQRNVVHHAIVTAAAAETSCRCICLSRKLLIFIIIIVTVDDSIWTTLVHSPVSDFLNSSWQPQIRPW